MRGKLSRSRLATAANTRFNEARALCAGNCDRRRVRPAQGAASMRPALYARETGPRCNPRHQRLVSHQCERSSQMDPNERSHVLDSARA